MFSWLFSKPKEMKVIGLIDVTSGSIGGALGVLHKSGQPEILFQIRQELPMRMHRSSADMAKDTFIAAKAVMDALRKAAALNNEGGKITPKKIEHVAVFLSAPWSSTSLRQLRFSRERPFVMSSAVLRRMLTDEAQTLASHEPGVTRLIEKIALGIRLNGYNVESISSAAIMQADVTLAASVAPRAFIDDFAAEIGDLPHGTKLTFHSNMLPTAHALATLNPTITDALIIDAGAEVTEIVLIKNGIPSARGTAPVGTNILFRTSLSHAKMGKKETQTAMRLAFQEGTRLSESHKSLFTDAAGDWAKAVSEVIRTVTEGSGVPQTIDLFADSRAQQWLASALEGTALAFKGAGKSVLNIRNADSQGLGTKVKNTAGTLDTSLALKLLYADARFDENHRLELLSTDTSILERSQNSATIPTPTTTV